MPKPAISADLKKTLATKARRQYIEALKYRQPKLEKVLRAEELYFNIVSKTLRGRFNIPLPIVSGFVDTLLSKIDDEITINYDRTEVADTLKAKKISAAWKYDSAPTRGAWAIKDILAKKLAIFSGRAIYEIYSESDPVYKNNFNLLDIFDFYCESNGGWHLENHLFCGKDNVFRTRTDLENGSQYDQDQVKELVTARATDEYKKKAVDDFKNHQKRLNALGLNPDNYNYVGEDIYNLCQHNMEHEGERYYVFFEPISGIAIRVEYLEEITGEPEPGEKAKYMYKSWATHYDAWNFYSKAPVDDVVPIAVGLKTIVNFMFDDVQKRLFGQRIYDPEIITDPSQLEWDRPDKLIMATVPNGKKISDGVYEFTTGDKSTITVNLVDYMRGFLGTESGVTAQAKGKSDEKLLGIAEINQGEVSDRLGLTNKFYSQCHAELGDAYMSGIKMCLTEKMLVRMIGENGTEAVELTREDLKFSSKPDVRITGGRTEAKRNEQIKEAKTNALLNAAKIAPDVLNKKVAIESLLENGGFEADEITALMDVNYDGNEEESVRASQVIQDALNKKPLKLYTGATTRFMQKIIDFANKKEDIDPKVKIVLMQYAIAHKEIVIKNMARAQMIARLMAPPVAPNEEKTPVGPTAPVTPVQ